VSLPAWLSEVPEGVVLRLLIQPKASRSELVGPHGEPPRLKVRVAAPPVDGAANEELLRFLKKELRVHGISLLRGQASKQKDVLCPGISGRQVLEMLKF
jgi:uncharacterized protein (TIGR00251 family)